MARPNLISAPISDRQMTACGLFCPTWLKAVEDEGFERISEVEMDDDVWEIEAYKNGEERELKVDPKSAEIISDESDSFL